MAKSRKVDIIGAYIAFGILVVVAIVYSIVTRTRGTTTPNSVCISNERQLGLALAQYSQDYDHHLPSGIDQQGQGWAGQIRRLVKSTDVFKCPDDPTTATAPNATVSYGYNLNIALHDGKIKEGDPRAVVMLFEVTGDQAELDKADEGNQEGAKSFSATGDGTDGTLQGGYSPDLQYATGVLGERPTLPTGSQFAGPDGRHRKGANYLMADGHSHWYLPSKISSGVDAQGAKDFQTGTNTGRAAGTGNGDFIATFSTR